MENSKNTPPNHINSMLNFFFPQIIETNAMLNFFCQIIETDVWAFCEFLAKILILGYFDQSDMNALTMSIKF